MNLLLTRTGRQRAHIMQSESPSTSSLIMMKIGDGFEYAKKVQRHVRTILEEFDRQRKQQNNNRTRTTDSQQSPPPPFSLISNFETQIVELQSLLIWEKPQNSILALLVFSCFYWIVALWGPRFLAVVATMAFCYHFYEMWNRYVWPEIRAPSVEIKESWTPVNPKVLSVPEIELYFNRMKLFLVDSLNRIIEFRRRSHGAFCCYSILFFVSFYLVGHFIPGNIIAYLIAILLLLTPGYMVHFMAKTVPQQQNQTAIGCDVLNFYANTTEDNESPSTTTTTSSALSSSNMVKGQKFSNDIAESLAAAVAAAVIEDNTENHRHSPSSCSESDESEFVMLSESELYE